MTSKENIFMVRKIQYFVNFLFFYDYGELPLNKSLEKDNGTRRMN
jgi:hypothetical protein